MIGLEKARGWETNFMCPSRCYVSRHNVLHHITSCFSFQYNKQLIAQLVGRHEDLFNQEKFMSPSGLVLGEHEFSGLNKSSLFRPNWAINVYSVVHVCVK